MCKVYAVYKFSNALHRMKVPLLPSVICAAMRVIFKAYIPFAATIGKATGFGYGGLGVVVHPGAVIGESCSIGQNVTIGTVDGSDRAPIVGDNVLIGVGAAILGPVRIGDNAKIGANAVVLNDVPRGITVVGIPAEAITR